MRARRLSDGTKGVLLVATGVVVLSPDSLLIRLMTVDEGTLLLLRGAFSLAGYVVLQQLLSSDAVHRDTWRLTRPELAVGFLLGITNVLFVTSILRANAALALVIIASAPAFTSRVQPVVYARGRRGADLDRVVGRAGRGSGDFRDRAARAAS